MIVCKQRRVMGRFLIRTPAMDSRVPPGQVWIRDDVGSVSIAHGDSSVTGDGSMEMDSLLKRNPKACIDCKFFQQGRYGLGKCGYHNDTRTIDDLCEHFETRMPIMMILVNPKETTRHFRRERQAPPGEFDRRSFRTVVRGGHRVVVGCPRGQWDNKKKRCKVGTRAQTVLHPKSEKNPGGCGFVYNPEMEERGEVRHGPG